jgi:hypothetical protein
MSDDITVPIAALGGGGGLIGLLTVIGGYLLRSHDVRLQKIEDVSKANGDAAQAVAADLGAYKLDSEKRFAKDDSVQASLARLHERIDATATKDDVKDLKTDVGGLRDDIKILIGKTGAT